ncbi:MAG: glycosyltransferase family 39 protein [Gemmatimonadota bacterium]
MPRSPAPRAIAIATTVFFVVYLLIGLVAFKDYGISWDEIPTREFGVMNVEHVVPDLHALDSLRAAKGPNFERFGPLYEIVLVRMEKALGLGNLRAVFLMRHLVTFLTFYLGVVLFHALCRRRFSAGISLLACLCLVASPQLFSHSFYNTKDVSFLTAFVAVMLTLDVLLERPEWRSLAIHALTSGLLMGTRILGLFAMMLTGVAALARRPTLKMLGMLVVYGIAVALILPVVWPVLRIDPIGIVKDAILHSTTNPYGKANLFRGAMVPATALPWDYVPTWILITTPYVISALFAVGAVRSVTALARHPREFFVGDRQRDLIVMSWFFLPVVGCMVLRPVLYDGWRHLFFVYPAMIYLAAVGMETILHAANARWGGAQYEWLQPALTAALVIALMPGVSFMYRNHPFEHLYFNRFAGKDMLEVKQRYELDYWGLSYRQLLEYIVRSDSSPVIRVHTANFPGMVNSIMLRPADQRRVRFVPPSEYADYFITNYRFHPEQYQWTNEVFSVRVGNASAASVFRLK